MTTTRAEELLIQLAQAQAEFEAIHNSLTAALDSAMPEEVKIAMSEIKEEFSPQLAAAEEVIKKLEELTKEAVVQEGRSVKTLRLHAVFTGSKPVWDSDKLEGYAAAHPDILTLRKFSEPRVTIRRNNQKSVSS